MALFKVAIKMFQIIEAEILSKDYAQTLYYLKKCTLDVDTNVLFKNVLSTGLNAEKLEKYYEKERKRKREGSNGGGGGGISVLKELFS